MSQSIVPAFARRRLTELSLITLGLSATDMSTTSHPSAGAVSVQEKKCEGQGRGRGLISGQPPRR